VLASSFHDADAATVNLPYWAFAMFIGLNGRQRGCASTNSLLHHGIGSRPATGGLSTACAHVQTPGAPPCPSAVGFGVAR